MNKISRKKVSLDGWLHDLRQKRYESLLELQKNLIRKNGLNKRIGSQIEEQSMKVIEVVREVLEEEEAKKDGILTYPLIFKRETRHLEDPRQGLNYLRPSRIDYGRPDFSGLFQTLFVSLMFVPFSLFAIYLGVTGQTEEEYPELVPFAVTGLATMSAILLAMLAFYTVQAVLLVHIRSYKTAVYQEKSPENSLKIFKYLDKDKISKAEQEDYCSLLTFEGLAYRLPVTASMASYEAVKEFLVAFSKASLKAAHPDYIWSDREPSTYEAERFACIDELNKVYSSLEEVKKKVIETELARASIMTFGAPDDYEFEIEIPGPSGLIGKCRLSRSFFEPVNKFFKIRPYTSPAPIIFEEPGPEEFFRKNSK